MITTQTFEFSKTTKDELAVLSSALQCLKEGRPDDAAKALAARQDELTRDQPLKPYDPRCP